MHQRVGVVVLASQSRQKEILKILVSNRGPVTTAQLGKELGVSPKTILMDLNRLQKWLAKYNVKMVRKRGFGVSLEGQKEMMELLLDRLKKDQLNQIHPYDPHAREIYIISRLLQIDKKITIQELAEDLNVSKVTIFKDLANVEKWLSKHGLRLIRKTNYGMEVAGEEKNWRKAIADFLMNRLQNGEFRTLVDEHFIKPLDNRLDPNNYVQLVKMFPGIDVKRIERIILEAEKNMNCHFTEETYTALIVHLVISIRRLREKKDIKMSEEQLKNLANTEEYRIAQVIAGRLEQDFAIKVPPGEVGYISLHILGAKIERRLPLGEKNLDEIIKNFDRSLIDTVYEIIKVGEKIFGVNLSEDKMLVTGLALHLRPVINRIKYGMNLHNPILGQIKENYTSVYGVAWIAAGIIEKQLGVKITEEEVGYLAMHLGAAINRATSPKNVLVVCSSGIGTAQLMHTRLERIFQEINIVDVASVSTVEAALRKYKNIDLVISTIPVELKNVPVIVVSPLITQQDIEKIKGIIGRLSGEKGGKQGNDLPHLLRGNIFPDELIFCNRFFLTKEEVIDEVGWKLCERGYVLPDFIKTVREREKITSTYIGKGVAIPHGDDKFVIKPAVSIIKLPEPVDWWEQPVDIIFYLALKFDDSNQTRKFFRGFYKMLEQDEILNCIRQAKTPADIKMAIKQM